MYLQCLDCLKLTIWEGFISTKFLAIRDSPVVLSLFICMIVMSLIALIPPSHYRGGRISAELWSLSRPGESKSGPWTQTWPHSTSATTWHLFDHSRDGCTHRSRLLRFPILDINRQKVNLTINNSDFLQTSAPRGGGWVVQTSSESGARPGLLTSLDTRREGESGWAGGLY